MTGHYENEENDPEVIAAKAAAEAKTLLARAEVIKARAQLHPLAQIWHTFTDSVSDLITKVGCFLVLALIALAIFALSVITWLTNLVN